MGLSGICFTYKTPKVDWSDELWEEVCWGDRDHPDPQGLVEWNGRAMKALLAARPDLKEVEPGIWDDGRGSVYLSTGGGDITMVPVKQLRRVEDTPFSRLWACCTAIASAGPTFAFDLDYYWKGPVEVYLDEVEALSRDYDRLLD